MYTTYDSMNYILDLSRSYLQPWSLFVDFRESAATCLCEFLIVVHCEIDLYLMVKQSQ